MGVKSHINQLNCISYQLDGKKTNIVEDWLNIYHRINDYAINNNHQFVKKGIFLDQFSKFIPIFFPYNTLTNGRLKTLYIVLILIHNNLKILFIPSFVASALVSILLPNKIIEFIIEYIKKIRLIKNLDQLQIVKYNNLLRKYYL